MLMLGFCPVETCVSLIGSKWRLLIMRDLLLNGSMRFKTLQRSIGNVSQKVLATNLRGMEDAGLVVRRVYVEVPPRVEYSLTELGQSLRPIMDAMWDWGRDVPDQGTVTSLHPIYAPAGADYPLVRQRRIRPSYAHHNTARPSAC